MTEILVSCKNEDFTSLQLLCAFLLSKLDYCNPALSASSQNTLNKFERVQNSAASLVMNPPSMVMSALFCAIFTGYQYAQQLITRC